MISSLRSRKTLHYIGIALGVAGIAFVVRQLLVYRQQIDLSTIDGTAYATILVLSVVYGTSNLLLSAGWRDILGHLGVECGFGGTVRIYALSQLAKYVPGNIFHLVGRQALGAAAGISHGVLARSTAIELAVIGGCTLLFAALLLPVYWPTGGALSGLLLFILLALSAFVAIRVTLGSRIARSAAWYWLYLIVSGAVFVGAYLVAGGSVGANEVPVLVGAYVLAWLAGLVTPGAPAGIGVREATLLFLLAGLAPPPVVLLAVVIGRAITVLGDLGFYFAGGLRGATDRNDPH